MVPLSGPVLARGQAAQLRSLRGWYGPFGEAGLDDGSGPCPAVLGLRRAAPRGHAAYSFRLRSCAA